MDRCRCGLLLGLLLLAWAGCEPHPPDTAETRYAQAERLLHAGRPRRARYLLRRAALDGHVPAQLALGHHYGAGRFPDPAWNGRGPSPHHRALAERWFRRAAAALRTRADGGEAEAQFLLAGLHFSGSGVPADRPEARRLWEAAAAQGHPQALYQLGWLDWWHEKHYAGARAYWTRAASLGHLPSYSMLARLHLNGEGVPASVEEYAGILSVAIRRGSGAAREELTVFLDSLDRESARGNPEAAAYLRRLEPEALRRTIRQGPVAVAGPG